MDNDLKILLRWAYIHLNHHKYRRAVDYLQIANALSPDNPAILKLMAATWHAAGAWQNLFTVIQHIRSIVSDLTLQDNMTLTLMESLALRGLDKQTQSRKIFKNYIILYQEWKQQQQEQNRLLQIRQKMNNLRRSDTEQQTTAR